MDRLQANGQSNGARPEPNGHRPPSLQHPPARNPLMSTLGEIESAVSQYESRLNHLHRQSAEAIAILRRQLRSLRMGIDRRLCNIRGCHFCEAAMRDEAARSDDTGSERAYDASDENSPITSPWIGGSRPD